MDFKDDSSLLRNLSLGDEAAFNHFFHLNKAKVYGYLLSLVKLREIAEELTIDVFLKIWQKRETLSNINNLDNFIFIITKRKALDFLKITARNKKRQLAILNQFTVAQYGQPEPSCVAQAEQTALLQELLEQLPPQRKVIFTLSRIEGLSHDEIAQQLKISRNTVKNTISQTLKSMHRLRHIISNETYWLVFLITAPSLF